MPQLTAGEPGRERPEAAGAPGNRAAGAMLLLLLAGIPLPAGAGEETIELEEDPAAVEAPPEEGFDGGEETPPLTFERLWNDPTLGGKLHVTYRASVTGRIFDFKRYEYPFPGNISEADREQARQLAERHDDDWDADLDQYFSLHAKDLYAAEGTGPIQSAGGSLSFRYFKDIDGSPGGEEARNQFDSFSHRDAFQLYNLHARIETLSRHVELILGRQPGYSAEWFRIDGATAIFRGLRVLGRDVELSAFGGSRVTYYHKAATDHDGLGGGNLKAWLSDVTTLELRDVIYIENTFEAELRREFIGSGWASVAYRMINERPHAVLFDGSFDRPEWGLNVLLFYIGKLTSGEDDYSFDYTVPNRRKEFGERTKYFNIGDIAPYDEVSLEARKAFGRLGISAGGTVHRLREREAEDHYNTDWYEVWGGIDVTDPWWPGLTGRAAIRYVHTDLPRRLLRLPVDEVLSNDNVPDFREEDITGDGEPSHLGIELLVEQSLKGIVIIGGTLVLRSYDYESNYAVLEDIEATSVGGYVRWQATERTQWSVKYTYDTDYRFIAPDLDALHTVEVQFLLRW